MREAAAHDKAAASEAEMREEEMQAATTKLQKQLDKVRACTFGLSCLPTNKPCLKHMQAFSIRMQVMSFPITTSCAKQSETHKSFALPKCFSHCADTASLRFIMDGLLQAV